MSTQVANLSLVGLAVGQGSKIPLTHSTPPPTIEQQMRPTQVTGATLLLYNESGSGLTCLFPLSRETFTLAAGAWKQVIVPPGEIELDFVVSYILPNAPVSLLLADLYLPGEAIDGVGVLGNSPIGLSAVSLPVTQVIQDGQPAGQTIVESTPTGDPQTINWTTDGLLRIRPQGGANALQLTSPDGTEQVNIGCINGAGWFAFDNIGSGFIFQSATKSSINWAAPFTQVGGQATAGALGVPADIGQILHQNITDNLQHTVLNVSAPVTGFYRVNGYFSASGSTLTGTAAIQFNYGWTDPDLNAAIFQDFIGLAGASVVPFDTNGRWNVPLAYAVCSAAFYAKTGTAIQVTYQRSNGTPVNDFVAAVLERLA